MVQEKEITILLDKEIKPMTRESSYSSLSSSSSSKSTTDEYNNCYLTEDARKKLKTYLPYETSKIK